MAFDGVTVAALAHELDQMLSGGRISKIAQPETDALLLTVKTAGGQKRLLLSANPSLPLAYLCEKNLPSPQTAPAFLMLLRKHLSGARILSVTQPDLERVLRIDAEHYDEMGDLTHHILVLELMGKHSNLILLDENEQIVDAIRRIGAATSSVREVLPGRPYFIPNTQQKHSPFEADPGTFSSLLSSFPGPVEKALSALYTGISPLMARELCERAGLAGSEHAAELSASDSEKLFAALSFLIESIRRGDFSHCIYYHKEQLIEYAAIPLQIYEQEQAAPYESMSALLASYYDSRNAASRMKQKSADLMHVLRQAMERDSRKRELMEKQLKDTEKRDRYRLYGELIQSYGYGLPEGASELAAKNYYEGDAEILIPLDPTMSPQENAAHYYERYQKLKRTYDATLIQLEETDRDLSYLRSVEQALAFAENEADLAVIKAELTAGGYIRARGSSKKGVKEPKTRPLHYVNAEGFDFFVGKNNYQNETVTFELASGNDWWFHAKNVPGSHVIVKTGGRELGDRGFEEAAALAAWYSSAAKEEKVEVDYTRRKELKKPGQYKPGMVIYHTNYSMTVTPSSAGLTLLP